MTGRWHFPAGSFGILDYLIHLGRGISKDISGYGQTISSGRKAMNARHGRPLGMAGAIGTVRIGIALALLAAVMLAIFTLSSPVKAVSAGNGNGGNDETYNPIRIHVDPDGTIRVPFNKSVVFFNPYFGTTWDDLEVKCDDMLIEKKNIVKYKLTYNTQIGISFNPANELEHGVYVFITGKKNCILSLSKSSKYEYSIKVKSGTPWVITSVAGFNQISDCILSPSNGDVIWLIKTPISFERVNQLDLSSLDNRVYLIIPTRDCSFALVPEQSVVEFCSSLMERNVCEEASYIKTSEQASCMGEGGEVCIMPFDSVVDGERTMWGCCK